MATVMRPSSQTIHDGLRAYSTEGTWESCTLAP